MSAATSLRKSAAAQSFAELCKDISPEAVMVAVMHGENVRKPDGSEVEITDRMYDAAKALLQFRLPKLNAIDAETRNVEMSHEQWLRMMEGEDDAS